MAPIKFFTPQVQSLFERGAYLRVEFIWKLDMIKNCINYGAIIFHI